MGTYYSYNCQSCGTREYMQRSVRRCNFCGMTLCRRCKTDGVCPRDYRILLPNERGRLNSSSYLINNGCGCAFGTCVLVLLIGLGVGVFSLGPFGIFGIPIFVMISIAVGFIAGGKGAKKKVMAEILVRLNAEIESLKQGAVRDQAPTDSYSPFGRSNGFDQPANHIPTTSYIPSPFQASPDLHEIADRMLKLNFDQAVPAAGNSGTRTCNACGAQLYPIEGSFPAFCPGCGKAVN